MNIGSLVICINDNFPCVISKDENNIGKTPIWKPWINGIFEVEDVLGEYINIDMFNTSNSINWWKSAHFRKLSGDEIIEYQKSIENYEPMADKLLKMCK